MKSIIYFFALSFTFFGHAQTSKFAPLLVKVVNEKNQPISYDKILFHGRSNGKTIVGITGLNGSFKTNLPVGDIYDIKIDAIGEQMKYNTLEIPSIPDDSEYEVMELMIYYELPFSVTLSNLQFETGKTAIQSSSYPSLNQLAEYLIRKKTQKITIAGHTDNVGDPAANNALSLNRAEAVKKYLVSKGVPVGLLQTKGYGDSKPIADNSTETGRSMNRRTEIHIVH